MPANGRIHGLCSVFYKGRLMIHEFNKQALRIAGENCIALNPEHGGTGQEKWKSAHRELDLIIHAVKKSQPELFYTLAESHARELAADFKQ
jgi:hypothetical protein